MTYGLHRGHTLSHFSFESQSVSGPTLKYAPLLFTAFHQLFIPRTVACDAGLCLGAVR